MIEMLIAILRELIPAAEGHAYYLEQAAQTNKSKDQMDVRIAKMAMDRSATITTSVKQAKELIEAYEKKS